jgi:hypothetical protein
VSQTNGVDLPEIHEVSGDPGENVDRLAAFLKGQDIQLVYNPKIAPALGISYGGRIAILPGQSKAEEFSTLVHEMAHLCSVENYVVYSSFGRKNRRLMNFLHNITICREVSPTRRRGLNI